GVQVAVAQAPVGAEVLAAGRQRRDARDARDPREVRDARDAREGRDAPLPGPRRPQRLHPAGDPSATPRLADVRRR
ncbi:MAG: hypothetical protein FWE15_07045, partial [Actinomycetia bacterium]|nr:hypothetical protein [Actinomycetes bacterium]